MKFCILLAVVLGMVSAASQEPTFPFYPFKDGTSGAFLIANVEAKYAAVGLTKTKGAAFPDVAVACWTQSGKDIECNSFKCTAADKCTEDKAVMKFSTKDDKKVGAVTLSDTDFATYTDILWFEGELPKALDATTVTGKTWNTFTVTQYTATIEAADFKYTVFVSADKKEAENTLVSIDMGASAFGAVGFRKDGNADFPVYVIMCSTAQEACVDAACTDKSTCTLPSPSGLTSVSADKKNGKWQVKAKTTSTLASNSKFSFTASLKAAEAAKLEAANIQGKTWKLQVVRGNNSSIVAPTIIALSALFFVLFN